VPTTHAIQPDELYLPFADGVSSSPARYGVGDPRWGTDFNEQLLSAKVPILADYRNIPRNAEPEADITQREGFADGQEPALLDDSATGRQDKSTIPDHEEGIRYQAERNFFQRNPQLAKQAKEAYACVCQVCGFDFVKTYGALGEGFAEAHHLNPLSERPSEEWTAAVRTNMADVAVLCANCHRMIHRRKPALSIEELKALICANGGAERLG
jgi:5-methylcytosine-specific restriction endonuclease McrA